MQILHLAYQRAMNACELLGGSNITQYTVLHKGEETIRLFHITANGGSLSN